MSAVAHALDHPRRSGKGNGTLTSFKFAALRTLACLSCLWHALLLPLPLVADSVSPHACTARGGKTGHLADTDNIAHVLTEPPASAFLPLLMLQAHTPAGPISSPLCTHQQMHTHRHKLHSPQACCRYDITCTCIWCSTLRILLGLPAGVDTRTDLLCSPKCRWLQ